MGGNWWTRFVINVLALLWSAWMLIPTFLGESGAERIRAQAEEAQATVEVGAATEDGATPDEPGGWRVLLPRSRINLGLDLQGGIDMMLQVETDEAVVSTVVRDIKPLRETLEGEGLMVAEIRRVPGEPALLVRAAEGTDPMKIRSYMKLRYSDYEYVETRDLDGFPADLYRLSEQTQQYIASRAVEQADQTLRNRVDATGVKEPSIVRKGADRINIQLPGMENVEQAVAALGTTAVLEFMMVDEEIDEAAIERALLDARDQLEAAAYADDTQLSDWLVRNGKLPGGTRLMWEYTDTAPPKRMRAWVVRDEVILTGDDINDAHVAMNQFNEPYVAMEFKPRGAKVFAEVTGQNVGRYFAIVLDKKVRSAPRIRERIGGGRASIEMGTGDYQSALRDASVLSLVLRTGALPAPVTIGEVRTVGASLGADAIRSGSVASAISAVLVVVFMLLFYRKSGIVANVALAFNVVMLLALLAALGATLTLPGIAGIALTVGMAVDCNIVFYERIKEELRAGKGTRAAVDAGFDRALWAVLDANITTFIAGIVLYTYGTGPIKGFAATLMIGIVSTLFTGVFASRMLMELYARKARGPISI